MQLEAAVEEAVSSGAWADALAHLPPAATPSHAICCEGSPESPRSHTKRVVCVQLQFEYSEGVKEALRMLPLKLLNMQIIAVRLESCAP